MIVEMVGHDVLGPVFIELPVGTRVWMDTEHVLVDHPYCRHLAWMTEPGGFHHHTHVMSAAIHAPDGKIVLHDGRPF